MHVQQALHANHLERDGEDAALEEGFHGGRFRPAIAAARVILRAREVFHLEVIGQNRRAERAQALQRANLHRHLRPDAHALPARAAGLGRARQRGERVQSLRREFQRSSEFREKTLTKQHRAISRRTRRDGERAEKTEARGAFERVAADANGGAVRADAERRLEFRARRRCRSRQRAKYAGRVTERASDQHARVGGIETGGGGGAGAVTGERGIRAGVPSAVRGGEAVEERVQRLVLHGRVRGGAGEDGPQEEDVLVVGVALVKANLGERGGVELGEGGVAVGGVRGVAGGGGGGRAGGVSTGRGGARVDARRRRRGGLAGLLDRGGDLRETFLQEVHGDGSTRRAARAGWGARGEGAVPPVSRALGIDTSVVATRSRARETRADATMVSSGSNDVQRRRAQPPIRRARSPRARVCSRTPRDSTLLTPAEIYRVRHGVACELNCIFSLGRGASSSRLSPLLQWHSRRRPSTVTSFPLSNALKPPGHFLYSPPLTRPRRT